MLSTTVMLHERIVSLGRRAAVERLGRVLRIASRFAMVGFADGKGSDLTATHRQAHPICWGCPPST